jgi:Multicopper oxidase
VTYFIEGNSSFDELNLIRHGIRQIRTAWADGPDYITQCPIVPGATYVYRFTIINQEGTLWWHAHASWLRATVHGALIIYPKLGKSYPFDKPQREYPIILGKKASACFSILFFFSYLNSYILSQFDNCLKKRMYVLVLHQLN